MSMPALADATVEWFAPQSDITNPEKPNCLSRTSCSVYGSSHAYTLLIRL